MSDLNLWDVEQALHELMDMREEALDEAEVGEVEKALVEYVNRELVKVDGIAGYLRHCKHMANWAKQEATRQEARAEAWERREKALRKFVMAAMIAFGKKKLEGHTNKLVICANGGKTPVVIDNEAEVPTIFKPPVITYPVDKDMIRATIEAGREVKGAHLGERGQHLEVR